jgi:inorganic pyrophosphatase
VAARPVGVVWISYGEREEAKVVSVPAGGPTWDQFHDLGDVPDHLVNELMHFFDAYKELEPSRSPTVSRLGGVDEAWSAITDASS